MVSWLKHLARKAGGEGKHSFVITQKEEKDIHRTNRRPAPSAARQCNRRYGGESAAGVGGGRSASAGGCAAAAGRRGHARGGAARPARWRAADWRAQRRVRPGRRPAPGPCTLPLHVPLPRSPPATAVLARCRSAAAAAAAAAARAARPTAGGVVPPRRPAATLRAHARVCGWWWSWHSSAVQPRRA